MPTTSSGPPRAVEVLAPPAQPDREAVLRLADAVSAADGVAALSEQTLLELRTPVRSVRHLLVRDHGEELAGYAQLDLDGSPASAELAVRPERRRNGIGAALLGQLRELAPGVAVWAHGDLPGAQALAGSTRMSVVRELWQMGVALPAPGVGDAAPQAPAGLRVRTFVPGQDDPAWVRLNALAFADHPEQGRMTEADLRARQAEDWFDASLLWLVVPADEDGGSVPAASMWVKALPGEPAGEIYALAVHPEHQGRGLGRLLTTVALQEMARRGLREATLYVEGDNAPAIRTYRAAGFDRTALDVQYR
ncbi:mycothiol synthase [Georgenia sp. 10Sc9-8]|uniref:Mycothiol acetyltransferase n=1 Tax=Georgenia halotolerans TaxID=3028317 RepID=A0ABT5TZK0_9MICO|nr:mycothiol synthase [Georgenia halotolerans]